MRQNKMHNYIIIIEKAENNYAAYSPDVPGCIATGKTVAETKVNMQEALEFHIEGLIEDGEPVPEPTVVAEYVAVNL
jgi:predicted RNase H-like HicB family nuclease